VAAQPSSQAAFAQLLANARLGTSAVQKLLPLFGGQAAAPYLGGAQGILGLAQGIQGGNPIGAAGGALQLAQSTGLLSKIPGAGLAGPALGIASAAMNGGAGLESTVPSAMLTGAGMLAGMGAGAAGAAGAGVMAPIAFMQLGNALVDMEDSADMATSVRRTQRDTKESFGVMSSLMQAVNAGNLGAEIRPGLRAGDLLTSILASADRGELYATGAPGHRTRAPGSDQDSVDEDKKYDAEGIMPTGRYEALAAKLRGRGFQDLGANVVGRAVTQLDNGDWSDGMSPTGLGSLIAALDDSGFTGRTRGAAFENVQKWLDELTSGEKPAFDAKEIAARSPIWAALKSQDKASTDLLAFLEQGTRADARRRKTDEWGQEYEPFSAGSNYGHGLARRTAEAMGTPYDPTNVAAQIDQMIAQQFEQGNQG
jgi:hypothetical protein